MDQDIPDWLKQDQIVTPPVKQQSVPEDELPDWLKQGLEEMSLSPDDLVNPAHLEGAKKSDGEPGRPGLSEENDLSPK
jgi:hypothetical protein